MPKYDAFGREIGEDTLEGLGGKPGAKPRPAPPRPATPAAERRPAAAPDAAARQALAAQLRGAMAQAQTARSAAGPPVRSPSSGARAARPRLPGRLRPGLRDGRARVAGVRVADRGRDREDRDGRDHPRHPRPRREASKPAAAAARPRPAVARAEGQLRGGAAEAEQLGAPPRPPAGRPGADRRDADHTRRPPAHRPDQPGGALERFGPDSGPGFDSASTIPFARLRAGAPQRLARQGAAKLHVPVSTLQYLVPTCSAAAR